MAHRFGPAGDGSAPDSGSLASFVVDQVQGCAVVTSSGEIDVSTVSALREALQEAARSSQRTVLDLTEVSFLDSTGVGAILSAVRANLVEHKGGTLCLVGPSGLVLRVLTITGLTELVPICDSVEEAVAQPA